MEGVGFADTSYPDQSLSALISGLGDGGASVLAVHGVLQLNNKKVEEELSLTWVPSQQVMVTSWPSEEVHLTPSLHLTVSAGIEAPVSGGVLKLSVTGGAF